MTQPPTSTASKHADSSYVNGILAKMLSASGGAVLTALVTLPLDVVKTRMQAALPVAASVKLLPTARSCIYYPICKEADESFLRTACCHTTKGGVAKPASTLSMAAKIARREGVKALWSGLSPALVMVVPSTMMYMIAYDEFKQYLQQSAPTSTVYALSPMIAGVSGRILTTCIVSPLELLRTQLMYKSSSLNLFQYLRAEIHSQGVLSLWRGLAPTLWRDLPFSGVYWLIYEQVKRRLAQRRLVSATQPQSWSDTFTVAFGAGVCAGAVAATVTTPFDVVKTRQQLQMYRKKVCCAAVPSGTWDLLRFIAKEEGVSGLFIGLTARVAKVAPACAIMISSYELGKLAFLGISDDSSALKDKTELMSDAVD